MKKSDGPKLLIKSYESTQKIDISLNMTPWILYFMITCFNVILLPSGKYKCVLAKHRQNILSDCLP